MLVILFLNHVYDTSHLDIALCGISVTLLDSSVSFFLVMGYLCLFLPHGLTNENVISILFFSVASIYVPLG